MGLDMYLECKRYIGGRETLNDEIRKHFPEIEKTDNLNYIYISFEVGYWRKANAIHKWFVDNCQNGVDDCKSYYVAKEDIKTLLKLCKSVLKDRTMANDLLPSNSGFFFGSTDYDDWYFEQIEDTIEMLEKVLKLPDDYEFEYHSSW